MRRDVLRCLRACAHVGFPSCRQHIASLESYNQTCRTIAEAATGALDTLRSLEARHTQVSRHARSLHERCNRLSTEQVC